MAHFFISCFVCWVDSELANDVRMTTDVEAFVGCEKFLSESALQKSNSTWL